MRELKKKKKCVCVCECVCTRTHAHEKGAERAGEKWKKGDQNP